MFFVLQGEEGDQGAPGDPGASGPPVKTHLMFLYNTLHIYFILLLFGSFIAMCSCCLLTSLCACFVIVG